MKPVVRSVVGQLAASVLIAVAFGVGFVGAIELSTANAPMPVEWLTESEQEHLADLVGSFRPGQWTAGCLWEQRDPFDIVEVVAVPGDEIVLWDSQTRDGRPITLTVTLDVPVAAAASYSEVEVPGAFCYRPVE